MARGTSGRMTRDGPGDPDCVRTTHGVRMTHCGRMTRGGRTSGSVSIEGILIVPLFLAALFAIMEGSLWVHASSVAQAAAQDGARAATVIGGGEQAGLDEAQAILNERSVGEDWDIVTTPGTDSFTVTITGRAPSVVPGLSFSVHESATLPWEPTQ